jgi:hypothetical protein
MNDIPDDCRIHFSGTGKRTMLNANRRLPSPLGMSLASPIRNRANFEDDINIKDAFFQKI